MLRRRFVGLVTALVLALPTMAAPAFGDEHEPECVKVDEVTGECIIVVTPPEEPREPGEPGEPGGGQTGGGSPQQCVNRTYEPTGVIACTQTSPRFGVASWWSNEMQCYVGLAPDEEQNNPIYWQGQPMDGPGAIYFCEAPRILEAGINAYFFWSEAPPGGPAAPPDPEELARQAIRTMGLRAIDIGIVPEDLPGRVGIIGMPTWMWVENPGPNTVGPITRSASARGYTVTATARVTKVVWNMGDGKSVTCTGRGTPYADSYGRKSSPTCGHTYTRDGRYTVSATSYWTIEWSGIGQSGSISLNFMRSTTITMGESQVLVQ